MPPRSVILTALPVEYLAVRAHLTDLREETHPQGTVYEQGKFVTNRQVWEVGIAEVGAGNASAAIEAERAIAHFKPDLLFFVGIAGGIKDVAIGDVVAVTKVYGYESGKAGEQFLTRPEVGQSAHALVQRARAEARKDDWLQRLSDTTARPRAVLGAIAAGEKVIASKQLEVFQLLRTSYNDAIAVEMEGFGFLRAAFAYPEVKAIVIRGISDLIEGKNDESPESGQEPEPIRQEKASRHASAFAFEILEKLQVEEEETPKRDVKSTSPSFFAYDDAWVGRDNLIHELSDCIRGNSRLLILVGITGIGKTALGERLAVEVADWFETDWSRYHQENFDDEQQTSDFASVAARWLQKWGQVVTPDDRKDPQRLMYRLIQHLQSNRYLVQIDSLEKILQGNEDEGWSNFEDEWWVKFFESYLKATDTCESRIILTSQDFPGQIDVGEKAKPLWHCQLLSGLEKPEQITLFEKTTLDISSGSTSRNYLERIGSAYEGHPLALRVIAGEIKNRPFEGNVLAYWFQYGSEIEEVEKAITEAQAGRSVGADDRWQLDRFTRTLRRSVQFRLSKTFARLKQDAEWAYILLCEASVYRCPVPEDFWLSHLEDWDRSENEQRTALDTLRDRYLIEELIDNNQCLLRQHNLIRSVALEHLKNMD